MSGKLIGLALLVLLPVAVVHELATDEPVPPRVTAGTLKVAAESHADTYQRDAFGQPWKDIDHDGCSQREDVLARDLTGVTRRGRCVIVAGHLVDPYTGKLVDFTKADASAVQIDHRVALSEAWRSGAWAWTPAQREAFANDLGNLIATSGPVNQAKSDYDATEWQPDGVEARCTFARAVEATKVRYGLAADVDEARALRRMLSGCRS